MNSWTNRTFWTAPRVATWLGAGVAIAMMAFHVYTAGYGALDPFKQRNLHLTFALIVAFLLLPGPGNREEGPGWWSIALALLSLIPMIHLWSDYRRIFFRIEYVDPLTTGDYLTSVLLILLVLEAARRVVGTAMVIFVLCVMAYGLFGDHLPGAAGHQGLQWSMFVEQEALSLGGIYAVPLAVSSTYVVVFVLFGSVLVRSGMGEVMIDVARVLAGHTRGGPAKVAVIASGAFGSINGSSVANVVATGAFTVPLMKKIGYRPHFAAAVEATASTGGQLMPPIMGAAAFVMVEITGEAYLSIITAALLPAVFYYLSIGLMVHLEAGRTDQGLSPRASWQEVRSALLRLPPFLFPVAVLLYIMLRGSSPILAGFYAFWALAAITMLRKETRLNLAGWADALVFGAKNAAIIAIACAAAGLVIGVIEVLGVGLKFASAIFAISNGVFFLTLLMVMIGSIILGMGLPTTAAYVIVAAIAAPPLIELGLSPLAANLFVLYYACLSAITPPVAIAAYAAAGVAGADPFRSAITATKLGSAGFIVPFAFAYYPGMLMDGTWADILGAIAVGIMVILGLGIAIIGWFTRPMNPLWRAGFGLASLMMLYVTAWTTLVGVAIFTAMIVAVWLTRPKSDGAMVPDGGASGEGIPRPRAGARATSAVPARTAGPSNGCPRHDLPAAANPTETGNVSR